MTDDLTALLDELHRHGIEHDAERSDRRERLRHVEPETARLLAVLVRATGARALMVVRDPLPGTSDGTVA